MLPPAAKHAPAQAPAPMEMDDSSSPCSVAGTIIPMEIDDSTTPCRVAGAPAMQPTDTGAIAVIANGSDPTTTPIAAAAALAGPVLAATTSAADPTATATAAATTTKTKTGAKSTKKTKRKSTFK